MVKGLLYQNYDLNSLKINFLNLSMIEENEKLDLKILNSFKEVKKFTNF